MPIHNANKAWRAAVKHQGGALPTSGKGKFVLFFSLVYFGTCENKSKITGAAAYRLPNHFSHSWTTWDPRKGKGNEAWAFGELYPYNYSISSFHLTSGAKRISLLLTSARITELPSCLQVLPETMTQTLLWFLHCYFRFVFCFFWGFFCLFVFLKTTSGCSKVSKPQK